MSNKNPSKKKAVRKTVTKKAAVKKTAAKKKAAIKKSPAPKKKAALKKAVKKKTTANKKSPAATTAKKKAPQSKTSTKKPAAKTPANILKANIPDKKRVFDEKKITPIVFSLDDVNALLASKKAPVEKKNVAKKKAVKKPNGRKSRIIAVTETTPSKKRVLGAASLADILGFDPSKEKSAKQKDDNIPKKWQKYYKLLLELRAHVQEELDLHTADTLKHASGDDAGDLAHYGNHQADAGTDAFDRDFALSLVSSEQDALNEIEEAIQRMRDGSYGVCEVTGKPINNERLLAVPFARFSVEGQKEYEKNKRRKMSRDPGNIFADGDDTLKLSSDEEDED